MGFFRNFIKRKEEIKPQKEIRHEILEIAGIISDQDKKVMDELKECISDTRTYIASHVDMSEEWGLDACSNEKDVLRSALLYVLEEYNFVCVRDWKDEKDDFIYFVRDLEGFKKSGLSLEADWLDEKGSIAGWSRILDIQWENKDFCLAAIDIESDCYVLFVCNKNKLQYLQKLSEPVGYKIDYAKEI